MYFFDSDRTFKTTIYDYCSDWLTISVQAKLLNITFWVVICLCSDRDNAQSLWQNKNQGWSCDILKGFILP